MKILLFIFLVFIFLFPLFSHPFYISHDGENHVARFANYYQAFQDGQFPPRWAANFDYGYGLPVFIFFYPLAGYLASLLHIVGISFENAFKLLIGIGFISAIFTFYLWAKIFFSKKVAMIGGLLYGLAP